VNFGKYVLGALGLNPDGLGKFTARTLEIAATSNKISSLVNL